MPAPIWIPSPERIASAAITRYAAGLPQRFASYEELWAWSVAERAEFWTSVWDFCGVIGSRGRGPAVENGDAMPGARWFPGARLNFAENLLRRTDDAPAIIFEGEAPSTGEAPPARTLSFRELRRDVARAQRALHAAGVKAGDRVAGFLPNLPETIVAMLGAASLGAVWSSCSPDFGIRGVLDRFGQIAPRVLFTADGYFFKGQRHDCLGKLAGILKGLPSVERVVVVPFPGTQYLSFSREKDKYCVPESEKDKYCVPESWSCVPEFWDDFLGDSNPPAPTFERLPFDHPLYILYSSGTTGVPKCIVHGAGGTLLQHLKEHRLHTDVRADDRVFYFTTCGWMMWNWLASALASEATVLLYDGNPVHPGPEALWRFAERHRATVFGTSAKYLAALEKSGFKPRECCELSALRTICSTGSPLPPEGFDFVYRDIKPDVCLSSISGGTDIVSCFALGNPILPVFRGELQCRGLGMKVDVYDEDPVPDGSTNRGIRGKSLRGEMGELVCTAPFPSLPIGFWNDPDGARYRAAYFSRFTGPEGRPVWHHGDFAMLTKRGGMVIAGRSDATLNPGGVRIGTAEIYRQVETIEEVADSLVIGQDLPGGDVRVILFLKLRDGAQLQQDLVAKIKRRIRENTTPRHVPDKLIAVADIPYTISGKKVELAVRDLIHGRPVKNRDALANPQALDLYRDLPELRI